MLEVSFFSVQCNKAEAGCQFSVENYFAIALGCIATLRDLLQIQAPFSQPIRSKTKTNRDLLAALGGYMYLLRVLGQIASLHCLRLL